MSRSMGITDEKLSALADFEASPVFSAAERLVLRLAVAASSTPAEVTQELFDELRANFSKAQIVELAAVVAWENYRSRFNRVFDVLPQGFSEGAFCALPERTGATG